MRRKLRKKTQKENSKRKLKKKTQKENSQRKLKSFEAHGPAQACLGIGLECHGQFLALEDLEGALDQHADEAIA